MQKQSNKIILKYWKTFLTDNDQEVFEAWNKIVETNLGESFELKFEIENDLVKKIMEMTKGSPLLIHNFISVITANCISRYTQKNTVQLVSPVHVEGELKGIENYLSALTVGTDKNQTFKEQFVNNKSALTKALEMSVSSEELEALKVELGIGVRLEGAHFQWDKTLSPNVKIDWDLKQNCLLITGKRDSQDEVLLTIFGENVLTTLESCINNPYAKFNDLALQSEAEKTFLNNVEKSADTVTTESWIIPVFEEVVKNVPNEIALIFNDVTLSYNELNEKSNQLANLFATEHGVSEGQLVGVMLERSPILIASILALWKLGAAYIPIETGNPEKRVREIIENAELKLVLTNVSTQKNIEGLGVSAIEMSSSEQRLKDFGKENLEISVSSNEIAYVIYTSGSTGKPKGVMIEHYGMLNHIEGKVKDLKIHASTKLAQNAPFGFDISVWQMFAALTKGGTTVIYENELVYDCDSFVDRLNSDEITLLELVPSYLTEMLSNLKKKNAEEYYKNLDRVVLNAEPLLPWMVNSWLDLFPNIPIYNTYGATEVSDDISHFIIEEKNAFRTVPVLKGTINASQINLVDENFRPVPPGAIGEILLSGQSVGKGYLNDKVRTEAAFLKGPIENVTSESRVYKTGDLARFVGDGSLEFIGRVDKQVKINGQRVELGAIEHIIASLDEVTNSAVLPNSSNSELVAFYTGNELTKEYFQEILFDRLPFYMVPKVFVHLDKFPLSSNGKIQRSKLPIEQYSNVQIRKEHVAPETKIQKELAVLWEEVLGQEKVGLLDDFFEIGGHSLKIMNLFGKIRKKYEIDIELRDLFNHTNLESQAELIENADLDSFELIQKIPEADKYALSSDQERLWILSQVPEMNVAYNMPFTVNFDSSLNVESLAKSINNILAKYEILRTVFVKSEDGSVWQKINDPENKFTLPVIDCQNLSKEEFSELIRQKSNEAFDLEKGPLYTFELLKRKDGGFVFFTNVHHIISDGWSEVILINTITENYERLNNGLEIVNKELSIQYKDYAAWQKSELETDRSKKQLDYWLGKFSGEIPVIDFPSQKLRPKHKSHNGRSLKSFLPNKDLSQLKEFCSKNDGSLFSGLMSVWKVLTYIYTKQEDLIIGTPVARREHEQLADQIGFYVNVLAIRSQISREQKFTEFFNQVKNEIIDGYSSQSYPFDQIIDKLSLKREASRNPLFDIILVFQNMEDALSVLQPSDFTEEIIDGGERTAKVDLDVVIQEDEHGLILDFIYNSDIYDQELISGLINHFKYLVSNIIDISEKKIGEIDIVHGQERNLILNEFNNSIKTTPSNDSIISLFEKQVLKSPDNKAIVFGDTSWTYDELNKLSNQFANYLIQTHRVNPQEFVGVQLDRDEWMMVAYLGVLKARAIQIPVDTALPKERIKYIQEDSNWNFCIDANHIKEFASNGTNFSDKNIDLEGAAEDITYIIYTSGSTGIPKGVEVGNKGVVNYINWSIRTFNFSEKDNVAKHLNMAFDGSVAEVYPALLSGATLNLAPKDILLDLVKLRSYLESNLITILVLPPTVLDYIYSFNNQSLRLVIVGGGQFGKYENHGFEIANLYGPTEATVACLAYSVTENLKTIPIGKPIDNMFVYILDANGRICPVGVPGEICVSGVGLAKGYLNQEELTNQRFINHPFIENEKLYKTGDLGKWLIDGNVQFIGRLDDQVKIRGYRIELDEISNILTSHEKIEKAVSIVVENENAEKEIISFITTNEPLNNGDIRKYLKVYLPDYMLPSYYVHLDEIPLNQNGKLDKEQLPSPYESEQFKSSIYVAPTSDIEVKLTEIWKEILLIDKIGVDDEFFEIGGHSLRLTALHSRIKLLFEVDFDLRTLFVTTTIAEQAQLIESSDTIQSDQILLVEPADMYVISSSQKRLWLLSQISGGNNAYNIPGVRKFKGALNTETLGQALDHVVDRHEILRTVFKYFKGEVYQIIKEREELGVKLNVLDYTSKSEEEINAFSQEVNGVNFDIENGPLLRIDLVQIEEDEFLFFFNLHHIISDGWSMEVLVREVMSCYNSMVSNQPLNLPDLRIQYKDYAAWEYAKLENPEFLTERKFWLDMFQNDIPVLNLPSSFPRPMVKTFNGAIEVRKLVGSSVSDLTSITSEHGATLFMGLLGVMNILFYKYSGQTRQIIGTPIAGRGNIDTENQIGFYTNTLALLSDFSENDSFIKLLNQIKERTIGAFSNQMYPFDNLVNDLNLERDISRSPLFDFMIVLQNIEAGDKSVLRMQDLEILNGETAESTASKFDMVFNFKESDDDLILMVEYNTDIYEKTAIDRLMDHFDVLLGDIIGNKSKAIKGLSYMSQEEQRFFIEELNPRNSTTPESTIIELFQNQVQLNPDSISLVYEDKEYTYQELNNLSNQLAGFLLDQYEVGANARVALCMGRNDRAVIGILAILKTASAYIPVDLSMPEERRAFIIEDAMCSLVLDENLFDQFNEQKNNYSEKNISQNYDASNDAYLIYTSGTTGFPKGVPIKNSAIVNTVHWKIDAGSFDQNSVGLHFVSFSFDVSIEDMFSFFLSGGKMVLLEDDKKTQFDHVYKLITDHKVNSFACPPAVFTQLQADYPDVLKNVRTMTMGGELINAGWINDILDEFPNLKIVFEYGLTEAAVTSSALILNADSRVDTNINSIGKPITNHQIYILDSNLNPVTKGVVGQICISGKGLTEGYWKRPELNTVKFIDHPFIDGEKLFLTGDLGCYLENNEILFQGRIDDQVKIRGNRIELGEIENAFRLHKQVEDIFVTTFEENGKKELVMYYSVVDEIHSNELTLFVKTKLPAYMVPPVMIRLDKLPVTINGKVDRKKLPNPVSHEVWSDREFVEPENETEERLEKIWTEVLSVIKVSTNDSFFEVGGNSIKIIQLCKLVNEEFDREDAVIEFFQNPTIKSYADYLIGNIEENQLSDESMEEAVDDMNDTLELMNMMGNDEE